MKSAHRHLLSVLGAEFRACDLASNVRPLRILDVGCGYGQLILDLMAECSSIGFEGHELEIYGYEVYDHRAGIPGYKVEMLSTLSGKVEDVDWEDRIRLGAANEPWPFPDGFFDLAVSNQVLEHVENLDGFFQELKRVVRADGVAAHFYPSRETWIEPHCGVPFVHWLGRDRRRGGLRFGSRLGLGKCRSYCREKSRGLEDFCSEFDDYLERYVFFRRNSEILSLANCYSERAGFKYTSALLKRALRDDWDSFAYEHESRFRSCILAAPFVCSTLVQQF